MMSQVFVFCSCVEEEKPGAHQKYNAAADKFVEVQKEKETQKENTEVKFYLYAARCYHRGRSFEKAANILPLTAPLFTTFFLSFLKNLL